MSSRWQANKIGLINFWYYDEQEFSFAKGRMLLRGSNGSGKSVTMQSVIPLLLDGNMNPERLDPFGSRDRKMSSYLLEEGDEREERTGYLYLEFKRCDSETYLTIGMGIRARKGKPLDKWYFAITDGRRIGKDFRLYKELDEKVTLSKRELQYRIGDGGRVLERQAEYMEYVNRQIFGFENVEEYKEMIDLLIQLRTPKLSKDFKPSIINEILSDSLQPLSDEDLLPMSEAIENMDTMNMNLKARKEGKQAAEKISRVFDKYNRLVLYEKTQNYCDARKRLNEIKKEQGMQEQILLENQERVQELAGEQEELDAGRETMEKERDSLKKSDAVGLKEREVELEKSILEQQSRLQKKKGRLSDKQDTYIETEEKKRQEEDKAFEKKREIEKLLEEMDENAGDMAFEEHTFFADELLQHLEEPYGFDSHQTQLDMTQKRISEGLEILRMADGKERYLEGLRLQRERHQREEDLAARKVQEQEILIIQVQNEWKESLYKWAGNNEELLIPQDVLKAISGFAEHYGEHSDFAEVRTQTADIWMRKREELDRKKREREIKSHDLIKEYEETKGELSDWQNKKEPEPERSEAVLENRRVLQEKQIPYQEFYKVIEFGQNLSKEDCDHLEEALAYMGILDALVIDEAYKDQVLHLDTTGCDKYLFVQKGHVEQSLLSVLDLNDTVNNLFFNQTITNILGRIAYGGDAQGNTAVTKEGIYQIGVLTGTVTGNYEAGFLGTQARERNRQEKIRLCEERLNVLQEEITSLKEETAVLKKRMELLEKEYQALPGDQDLRISWKMLTDAEEKEKKLKEEGSRLEGEIGTAAAELRELKTKAGEIADKLYLTCRLDVFQKADTASRTYEKAFYRLKAGHEVYIQMIRYENELEEQLSGLDFDMDQIRYDMGIIERQLNKEKAEYDSVREQLKLTDYEEIKERLDACVTWLNAYPKKLEKCVQEKAQKEEQIRGIKDQIEKLEDKKREFEDKEEYLKTCFEEELFLGYAGFGKESEEKPEEVRRVLNADCQKMDRNSIIQELNQVYFENRGVLNDYQPMQTELFGDREIKEGMPSPKRIDMSARYQGAVIPFGKLLGYLEEEIQDLTDLIREGDRELFEDILANTISRKIRGKINSSISWVENMNQLMGAMNTSSGLKLSLRWRSRTAETEGQLDTKELVDLLKKDYRLMREEEAERLSMHFRSKVEEARKNARDSGGMVSFYQVMKETLDYRKWFEFQLFFQKGGEKVKELTNSMFGTFSGGEKAMAMYVPLFSAVVAKYEGGRADAPRLISLDEAFAGVDNRNIRDMFRLMAEFQFDFLINSQVLWGDCDTWDALAIYQLIRPENAKFVTVMPYLWNGKTKELMEDEEEMEQRAAEA